MSENKINPWKFYLIFKKIGSWWDNKKSYRKRKPRERNWKKFRKTQYKIMD